MTPLLRRPDGHLACCAGEVVKAHSRAGRVEEGVVHRLGDVTAGAIMEEETNHEIGSRDGVLRRRVRVGINFPDETTGVVRDAVEVVGCAGRAGNVDQVSETEIRLERGVGAELHAEFRLGGGGERCVEEVEDLRSELRAGRAANGIGAVPCEAQFVCVGEGAQLEERGRVEEVGGGNGGVVDFGDVDVVEDGVGIFVGGLALAEGAVDDGAETLIEGLGRVCQGHVLR